jgi:Chaperone of endosialidase
MKTRLLLLVAVLFAAFTMSSALLAQTTAVPFPRDQIALQLGAIQMGYATNGAPFTPADQQKAANALAQGRIALSTTTGWGSANVVGAIQPADYGAQLDAAVQAVMTAPVSITIIGNVALTNGRVSLILAKLAPPSPDWSVPVPYAISAITPGPQGIQGPQGVTGAPGPRGIQGPAGVTGGAGVGTNNRAYGYCSFVGGGQGNQASASYATVGGGALNRAAVQEYATVGGGYSNLASGLDATVGGGWANTASGMGAMVGGGYKNLASDGDATVSGGWANTASGQCATVGGGYKNLASGRDSCVPGGAAAEAWHDGSFVFSGDGGGEPTASFANSSFTVRCEGGARFYTANGIAGAQLPARATAWAALSDSNSKTDFKPIKPREILSKVAAMPVSSWHYKHDLSRRYIGPMAQDFHTAFGLGSDDKSISTLDSDGVMYAAIQGLVEELKDRDAKIGELEASSAELKAKSAEIDALKAKMEAMEERLNSLPPAR